MDNYESNPNKLLEIHDNNHHQQNRQSRSTPYRRRSLFQTCSSSFESSIRNNVNNDDDDDDDDPELGRILPLSNSDSDNEQENNLDISDYNIMEVIQDKSVELFLNNISSPSPSQSKSQSASSLLIIDKLKTNEERNNSTPHHDSNNTYLSPSQTLKTPHVEITTAPATAPSSVLFLQHSCNQLNVLIEKPKSLKRNHDVCQRLSEEEEKADKEDKDMKKRSLTAKVLFPDDMENNTENNEILKHEISAKNFYTTKSKGLSESTWNSNNPDQKKILPHYSRYNILTKNNNKRHNQNGVRNYKRHSGEINRGVHHKIRKRLNKKLKKIPRKSTSSSSPSSIINNNGTILNDYIKDILELKNENVRLISSATNKTTSTITTDIKRNDPIESDIPAVSMETLKNRKFFKNSRIIDKTQTKENQLKDNNKIIEKEVIVNSKTSVINDIIDDFEDDFDSINIENVLSSLNDSSEEVTVSNISILSQAPSKQSAVTSESATATAALDTILSPISLMCDVTSGLAINSPKKIIRNLTPVLNNMTNSNSNETNIENIPPTIQKQKLYPLFYKDFKPILNQKRKIETNHNGSDVKRFKVETSQWFLDAGQKNIGYTQCPTCNVFYYKGDPGDELVHRKYHDIHNILRFNGWKNEHIVATFPDNNSRIIKILFNDSKIWLNKVNEVINVIKRELGEIHLNDDNDNELNSSQVYFYIRDRLIIGCAIATIPKTRIAYKLLNNCNDNIVCSTNKSYSIKCGLTTIWVMEKYRKQHIATELLNTIKMNFLFGSILSDNDIALSSPTDDGVAFARKYFNKMDYLVY